MSEETIDETETMQAPPEASEDFESELWMSTDGKMTISVKAKNAVQRKASTKYAKDMLGWLRENYGSKQAFATKEYKEAENELGKCSKCGAPNKLSSKGKPYCSKKCWLG